MCNWNACRQSLVIWLHSYLQRAVFAQAIAQRLKEITPSMNGRQARPIESISQMVRNRLKTFHLNEGDGG